MSEIKNDMLASEERTEADTLEDSSRQFIMTLALIGMGGALFLIGMFVIVAVFMSM
jgi:hypothetical protein